MFASPARVGQFGCGCAATETGQPVASWRVIQPLPEAQRFVAQHLQQAGQAFGFDV